MKHTFRFLILCAAVLFSARLQAQTTLSLDTVSVACNSTGQVNIPLRVSNFSGIGSMQFTVHWDVGQLDFVQVSPLSPQFLGQNVNFGFDLQTFQSQGQFTFNWTYSKTPATPNGLTVPDGTVLFTITLDYLGNGFGLTELVTTGTPPVFVDVTDPNGNTVNFAVENGGVTQADSQVPSISCPANMVFQSNTPIPISGIAPTALSDNCSIQNVGWAATGSTLGGNANDNDASGATFNPGQTTVTYTATDVANNTATCSFVLDIQSTVPDTLTFLAQKLTHSCGPTTAAIEITAQHFAQIGAAQFSIAWDKQVLTFDSVGGFHPALNLSLNDFNLLQTASDGRLALVWATAVQGGATVPAGQPLFKLFFKTPAALGSTSAITFGDVPVVREAYDATGDLIPAKFVNGSWLRTDNVPPVLTCPQNIQQAVQFGQTSAFIGGLAATASDNCGGVPTVTFVRNGATNGTGNGSANGNYNVGTTTVRYTAADATGNTTTCTFTVAVTVAAPDTLFLSIDSLLVDCQSSLGQEVVLPIRVRHFTNIGGLQFNVMWDVTALVLDTIQNLYPGFNPTIFPQFFQDRANGVFHFLGGGGNWPNIPDDEILFELKFSVVGSGTGTSAVDFFSISPTLEIEAFDKSLNALAVQTSNAIVSQTADTEPPTIILCPASATVDADPQTCMANVFFADPTATDDCSGVQSVFSDHPSGVYPAGLTTVTYTVADGSGKTATCSLTVTVAENAPPVLADCPVPVTVNATTNECNAFVQLPSPTATDVCSGVQSIVSDHPNDLYTAGETVVTFTATDGAGNAATCATQVTVIEQIPPMLFNCPGDGTYDAPLGSCKRIVFWPEPLATDGCTSATLPLNVSHASGSEFSVGATTVTYDVADNTGLTASCSFVITIRDITPPSIACPPDMTIEPDTATCMATANWMFPLAADACDPSVAISGDMNPGDPLSIGNHLVTYTAVDNDNNTATCAFAVAVPDTKPIFLKNCPKDTAIAANATDPNLGCGATVAWAEPTLEGSCAPDSLMLGSDFSSGNFFPLGSTVVTYTGSNPFGAQATCSFTVRVEDKTPPVFANFPNDITIELPPTACSAPVLWQTPTATDNCGNVDTITMTHTSGTTFQIGTTPVVFTATDSAGNVATRTLNVTIRDVTPPTLNNCPPDMTVEATGACEKEITWPKITGTDQCDPIVVVLPANLLEGGTFPAGDSVIKFIGIDGDGNYDSCFVHITVNAVTTPAFMECPQNQLFFGCESPLVFWQEPTPTGFCNGAVTVTSNHQSGETYPIGATMVTYTATNGAGASAVCEFTITVAENTAPIFSCPQPIEVNVAGQILSDPSSFLDSAKATGNCIGARLYFEQLEATDNCLPPTVTQESTPNSGQIFPIGSTSIVFKATDGAGNTAICNISVTVVDLPALQIEADPPVGCPDDNVFVRVLNPIPGASYTWKGPEPTYPDVDFLPLFLPGNEGVYSVFATINGCRTGADTTTVTLITKPDAVEDPSFEVKAGDSLDSLNVGANDQYTLFSDAVWTQLDPLPTGVQYEGNGIFSFAGTTEPGTLTFMYRLCSKTCPDLCDQTQAIITVLDTRCVFLPNIISPNGDGINDEFYIPCLNTDGFDTNELVIYNQWGDRVFEAAPYKNNWKGTLRGHNGQDLPDGVYYYVFKPSATAEVIKGFVEIYR